MSFDEILRSYNIYHATGVPCSIMKQELKDLNASAQVDWIPAVDEATALGIANGLTVGGKPCIVMMQNSAMGVVADKIMSFNHPYNVETLLYITMRGYQGDTIVHQISYDVTIPLLSQIGFYIFDNRKVSFEDFLSFENLPRKAYLRYKDE